MKTGVLTVHRAINIGAILQTFALQELLKNMGNDSYVVNYIQEKVERTDRERYDSKKRRDFLFHGHLHGFLTFNQVKARVAKRRKLFDDFLRDHLQLTEACNANNIPQDFDAYVIGSDQLWNSRIFGYQDPVFWGNFTRKEGSKVFAYADSTTVADLESTSKEFLEKSLQNFDAISVREKEVADYLNATFKLPKPVELVLDPTITAGRKLWDTMRTEKCSGEKYVLVYCARPYQPNPQLVMEKAQKIADRLGCKVKELSMDTASDFIDQISNAEYVLSSSYHGIVFSLIYNRPLYALMYGDDQDRRYVNLLKLLGAEKMLLGINEEAEPQDVDYAPINERIDKMVDKSKEFLNQIR